MSLSTTRLGGTDSEPFALEVKTQLSFASPLLWHVARLPGVKVIAKKSWALTDDFEAYFIYQDRLFVVETPFVNVWVSLLGQPADEAVFREIEARVQSFNAFTLLLLPLTLVWYLFFPYNPPRAVFEKYYPQALQRSPEAKNAL